MAQIPGNELFPDQKRNYGGSNVKTVLWEAAALNDFSDPYYPGNARCVLVISTEANGTEFYVRDNATDDNKRQMVLTGQIRDSTGTQVGIISGDVMPHEFFVKNKYASGANDITIHFVY